MKKNEGVELLISAGQHFLLNLTGFSSIISLAMLNNEQINVKVNVSFNLELKGKLKICIEDSRLNCTVMILTRNYDLKEKLKLI